MATKTKLKINKNTNQRNTLKRTVLVEKTKNNILYIYTVPNMSKNIINPFKSVWQQISAGVETAKQQGLEPIEYSEAWLSFSREKIIGKTQLSLLKLVIIGRAKFIYCRNIAVLARNRTLRSIILHIYRMNSVMLFDRNGVVSLETIDCSNKVMDELDYLIQIIDDQIKTPYEGERIN